MQRVTRLLRSADGPEIYFLANQKRAIQTPARVSAQGPVAWNARNSYGYTYVYSLLKWVVLNHLGGPLREFSQVAALTIS